jgi:ribonuclease BN (tRNA processing enzyme)
MANVQVLGIDAADATPSLVLNFETKRILFNCGEGTQRLCNQYKVRVTKLEHIFLTRATWEHTGGLPGMIMTMSDSKALRLAIHGPPNLLHMVYATRYYMYRRAMHIDVCAQVRKAFIGPQRLISPRPPQTPPPPHRSTNMAHSPLSTATMTSPSHP